MTRNMPSGDQHWTRRRPERLARGERHGRSMLMDDEVEEIRTLAAQGFNAGQIARLKRLKYVWVYNVVSGRTHRSR